MRYSTILLPVVALVGAALPVHATPFKPAQVSGMANWFVHADLDALRSTETGKTLMEAVEAEHGAKLRAIKRMFSLNPLKDLKGITLYGSGEKDEGVVLIRAACDRAHLEDLIAAAKDHETSKHGDATVHSWFDEKKDKPQHGAFHNDDLVIISDHKRLVRHALDVLSGAEPHLEAGHGYGTPPAPVLVGLVNLEGIDVYGHEATLVAKAKSVRARLMERNHRVVMEMTVEAADRAEAARFRKVLDGMIALGELAHDELAAIDLESSVTIDRGTFVTARLSAPNRHVLELIDHADKLKRFMD